MQAEHNESCQEAVKFSTKVLRNSQAIKLLMEIIKNVNITRSCKYTCVVAVIVQKL